MHLSILSIGRMKRGPEQELLKTYLERANKAGPSLHLFGPKLTEFPEARSADASERKSAEANKMLASVPAGAQVVLLDETGKDCSSVEFSRLIAEKRDSGTSNLCFALGGPDGHGDEIRNAAMQSIRFGKQTWPHQIARILLAEQIYRAMTILSGHPYHRA